jgi:membrane protease YdiL (CAAX protease family)
VRAGRCCLLTVAVLAAVTLARGLGLAGQPAVYVTVASAALIVVAWSCRAALADLGLRRVDLPSGLLYGAAAFGFVLAVLILAAAVPLTKGFLHDARAQIGAARLAYELSVTIVLLTAVPEEFAFRGLLLGAGVQLWGPWRGVLASSALFGLWHVQPTLITMSANPAVRGVGASTWGRLLVVLGAVAVTFAAGLAFSWLRLRSRSLLAPVLAHVATNGLGLAVAWVVVHGAG